MDGFGIRDMLCASRIFIVVLYFGWVVYVAGVFFFFCFLYFFGSISSFHEHEKLSMLEFVWLKWIQSCCFSCWCKNNARILKPCFSICGSKTVDKRKIISKVLFFLLRIQYIFTAFRMCWIKLFGVILYLLQYLFRGSFDLIFKKSKWQQSDILRWRNMSIFVRKNMRW